MYTIFYCLFIKNIVLYTIYNANIGIQFNIKYAKDNL